MTAYDILKERGEISREVIAAEINGEACDLATEVAESDVIKQVGS